MSDTIRRATPEDLPAIIALANRVFRARRQGDMGAEFPVLFSAANAGNLHMVVRDGRVVSHVGVLRFTQSIDDVDVPVACIGAVCTDPDCRGQGLAGGALESAIADARARGDVLMPISGARTLYTRVNALSYGPEWKLTVPRAALGAAAGRPFVEADTDAVIALHERQSVRYVFERPRFLSRHAAQLGAGMVSQVRESGGRVEAWVLAMPGAGPSAPVKGQTALVDFAGEPEAVASLAAGVMDAAGDASLLAWLPWYEPSLRPFLATRAQACEVVPRNGRTLLLLNPLRLVELLADRLAPLSPRVSTGVLELTTGGGTVIARDPVTLHHLLFTQPDHWPGPVMIDRALARGLFPHLPIPIPAYGLCYV
ncbi:MAG: hypothetical protein BIFFINMI_00997 [Phycisphaerae bacterium]|nr:hypothetical protein [Phycisphaerae bacterium]